MSTSDDVVTQYCNNVPVDEFIDWDSDPLAILLAREEAQLNSL
jgi:hypothetical protein